MKRATIKDVARLAGVSTATVSYVLNNSALITPATRERVLQAVHQLGYRPSTWARVLAGKAARTMAVVASPGNELGQAAHLWSAILGGVGRAAWESSYALVLVPAQPRIPGRETLLALKDRGVEGAIFFPPAEPEDFLPAAWQEGLPVVSVGEPAGGVPWQRSPETSPEPGAAGRGVVIRVDHRASGYQAASHLLSLNRRRLVFLAGPGPGSEQRWEGVQEAVSRVPGAVVSRISGDGSEESGFQVMDRLLHRRRSDRWSPDAVVAYNDAMALGAMRALAVGGQRVPEAVAVVGFGDDPLGAYVPPALTTFRLPVFEIGQKAVQCLVRMLSGEPQPAEVLLPARLVIRESCGSALWI
ncbi:MAG: LacI family DNA-binding transcriptional regulator [Firmicutes bacterium]|nr:LacI family DNA-binding transcriptional regulator [Bacillota bacterium]